MKTFYVFLVAISFATFSACENSEVEPLIDQELIQSKDQISAKSNETVTVPFKANLYTKKVPGYENPGYCNEDGYGIINRQVGEGTGTHLGNFSVEITFCGSNTPGDFIYKTGTGTLFAANGDELFIEMAGEVIPLYGDPFYELYFTDPFTIVGGTGRFEDATGSGVTNSYVNLIYGGWANFPEGVIDDHQTDHEFTGTLTFMPGSRSN